MPVEIEITRPPLPRRLQVEVTASCNLRCRMCIVRYRPTLPRSASMSFERFKALLDELPDVTEVSLQGIGEPLLAPDIFAMVAYASARGVSAGFNSNATLLTRSAGERLIDAGLDWICFSLDGAGPETYEFVRDGARWETVERNISGFMRLLRERGAARPTVSLVFVLMRRNLPDLPAVVERAAAWGIPRVFVQGLSHDFSDAEPRAYAAIAEYVHEQSVLTLPPGEVEVVFERARRAAARGGVELRLPHLDERTEPVSVDGVPVGCDWPWRGTYVTYTGTVLPCCMVMGNDRVELGSVTERPFAEIWEGERFQEFRAGLVNGTPHAVCQGCSLYRGTF
jgi:radical SAM protein with 4Fe4S-binding SPASM domain